jgi:hypothetical protein
VATPDFCAGIVDGRLEEALLFAWRYVRCADAPDAAVRSRQVTACPRPPGHGHARPGQQLAPGDTPDLVEGGSDPAFPGYMTRGICDPATYYYRRVFSDAVSAATPKSTPHASLPREPAKAGAYRSP